MGNDLSYYDDPFYSGRGGYTDGWGNPRYENMNPVSEAALRRLRTAKETFDAVRKEHEERLQNEKPGTKTDPIELLTPDCHLVDYCWSRFGKYVRSFAGWKVKRRVANPEERKKHHIHRKGKTYFVTVTYVVPKAAPPKSSSSSASNNLKRVAAANNNNNTAAAVDDSKPAAVDAPPSKKQRLVDLTNGPDEEQQQSTVAKST